MDVQLRADGAQFVLSVGEQIDDGGSQPGTFGQSPQKIGGQIRAHLPQPRAARRDKHPELSPVPGAYVAVPKPQHPATLVGRHARELLGGNGILLENRVGRFVADAEAIYSYEGTREINTLVVGRAITGFSAFV